MSRLTELIAHYERSVEHLAENWDVTTRHMEMGEIRQHREYCQIEDDTLSSLKKLKYYEDLEEAGRLIDTHKAAVILAEAFGYEHPCNFNGIDEWFPEACDCADLCPDGKMSAIACWEQYIKIKPAELKGGAE